jgi:glucoamylase
MEPIEPWLDQQYRHAASAMLRSISPVGIVKQRPGFGQTVRPCKGAIVASPVLASYDPDPDYFFHWYRDSAVIIDALRLLYGDRSIGATAREHLVDFVHFSHALLQLDGRALVAEPRWRAAVAPDFTQFLRTDADLDAAHGEAIAGETRVNPDGTLDISRWPRPQHDGLALRALALLRWTRELAETEGGGELAALIRFDLDFTARHWREPSFDIWEEERGQHYYTLRVAAAALLAGADWIGQVGEADLARHYRAEAQAIHRALDEFWLPDAGYYRSRVLSSGALSTKELDIAVILAAIHSDCAAEAARHSAQDPRMHSTLERLESLFDAAYAINRGRGGERGPAMGRYSGDVYYSGGAYFFSTLGAAEFCFRAARGAVDAGAWIRRGDAYLRTVRAYIPSSGAMSEQFDQHTGAQTSARELAWSYAAFISCVGARREVIGLVKRS